MATTKNKVDKLRLRIDQKLEEIRIIQFKISNLQDKCEHGNAYKRTEYNFTDWYCPDCDKSE